MMSLAIIGGTGRSTDVAGTQPLVKFTYEDYLTTPADTRYELLDGDLIMVPAPNLKHQEVQFRWAKNSAHSFSTTSWGSSSMPPATCSCSTPTWCSRICCSRPENARTC